MDDNIEMGREPVQIDKVLASKAGHAFHEAWAARSALELLIPSTQLAAITLEGFDVIDEGDLDASAVEIADMVRYYGNSNVAEASRVEIVQFKYSIARASIPARASDLVKTLKKFANTDVQLRAKHGDIHVEHIVHYEFATNRPIHQNLITAIAQGQDGGVYLPDVIKQRRQVSEALEDYPYPHETLLHRLILTGGGGALDEVDRSVSHVLASWSEASDPEAEKRLLKLRNLVRTKAGPSANGDKRIERVAVLAELEVDHEDRLYPTPAAFMPIECLVKRSIISDAIKLAREGGPPLIVHGAGGMGKTVLMQSIAEQMASRDQVVIFDGFGAGRWRDPADGRFRAERTLVHLANLLAGRGLCDILLPISDITSLLRAFRSRLVQSVASIRQADAAACVVLVLDAIDHAAISAVEFKETSFAQQLLRSFCANPIDGVMLIGSCRTERLGLAVGDAEYRGFEIPPFTPQEIRELILKHDPDTNDLEIATLEMRSGRNPRCLNMLLIDGRPYDSVLIPLENNQPSALLDTLLNKRLLEVRRFALSRGVRNADIDLLLMGIALLPPPVPLEELAVAHGIAQREVESFAADLAPLLERTPHGLMFRDEPTETLIRQECESDLASLERIVGVLTSRQANSNYAARALPSLLVSLERTEQLIALATDVRVPSSASKVSRRDIRLTRITAALNVCSKEHRSDDLAGLLLEASIVGAGHERTDRFLCDFPDLASVAGDVEALRRLFTTKICWPGERHSALAIAHSFAGEMGEALRNSRRAIDWQRWASSSSISSFSELKPKAARNTREDLGIFYVQILAGNDVRAVKNFERMKEGIAYQKISDLFELFERHKVSPNKPSYEIFQRLRYCRSRSRALWAAALEFSNNAPDVDRWIVKRFARANASANKHKAEPGTDFAVIARGIDLGLIEEAKEILSSVKVSPPILYDYTSHWHMQQQVVSAVILAGLKATVSKKAVTIIDLLPEELILLVSPSVRKRSSAAFINSLKLKLTESSNFKRKVKIIKDSSSLSYEKRSEYSRVVTHRIEPLLSYAQWVVEAISPPKGFTRSDVLNSAFDQLERNVNQASEYPYTDTKSYLAWIGFHTLFFVADSLAAIDEHLGSRIANWLLVAPGIYQPEKIKIVTRLSRIEECHDAALKLARHIESRIVSDTDVSNRINSYGELARAVWRVSTEEAASLFRRTIDLADAVGADDIDRTNSILELTRHYSGNELSAEAAHGLARILELSQNEDSKFPWFEYAQTMVPAAGLGALPIIARLDDREMSDLGRTLGPTLTVLVSSGKLKADLACCLYGLAEPIESWTWQVTCLIEAALEKLPKESHEWLFTQMLIEIDRSDQLSPTEKNIEELLKIARRHLPKTSMSLSRIEGLAARNPGLDSQYSGGEKKKVKVACNIDITDPDQIDRAILSKGVETPGWGTYRSAIAYFATAATVPAKRLGFVNAVVNSNVAGLADKLEALKYYLPDWSNKSTALKDALPNHALTLATKHSLELVSSDWQGGVCWDLLDKNFEADRKAVVERVVTSLCSASSDVTGDSWLMLAAKLAPKTSNLALASSMERFIAQSASTIPAEVGDGPWAEHFLVTNEESDIAAGMIWSRLGHRSAKIRWRGVHAVMRLAQAGRFDAIDRLVERFGTSTALPFGDVKFPFFTLHARLWLMISLARIALDFPVQVAEYRALFEQVAFDKVYLHVVMQAFAVDALIAIAPTLDSSDEADLLASLHAINQSPFPHQSSVTPAKGRYSSRPKQSAEPANNFVLEYDFNKHHVEKLCDVFGCAVWEAGDAITGWVRQWDCDIEGMHDCARSRRHDERYRSSDSTAEIDTFGGYLGWHALMLVAGDMLSSRIVTGSDWYGVDAWTSFLASYRLSRHDGKWLSDATDLFPLSLTKESDLPMDSVSTGGNDREDHDLLSPLIGICEGKLDCEWMPVGGRWSLPGDVTLSLSTVLADRIDADAAVMTVVTDEKFFRRLPHDSDDVEREFGGIDHSVRSWIDASEHSRFQIDLYDPYSSLTSMSRSSPSPWVCQLLKLKMDDQFGRSFSDSIGACFLTEVWGASGGRGEYSWERSGQRICISRERLLSLLQQTGLVLVGLITVQKYHRNHSSGRMGGTGAFTNRTYSFIVSQEGAVSAPLRASKLALSAIKDLDRYDRDFNERFKAISARIREL
ncbi:hypothetical protein AU074_21765 [Pseudomonas sp. ATCC PTA-122608]|uniref:NACHT domain-containing protein n=1 Tax=Pseudomonas sp. ATCC PTA-122608 TaxID=1771311 RepID=UPI00096BC50D|nr:NACHT domain-containing protein [Pseudomonas sp. ATCC PTA-122608]OLY75701.1 hypothetical protein AU074_21765 [Pseudomonas sp. ATCC PTA-122608]